MFPLEPAEKPVPAPLPHFGLQTPGLGSPFSSPSFSTVAPPAPAKGEDASIWRDTALRYGGYADEVGEFLTPYLGGLGTFLGYGISSLYVLADLITTLPQKFRRGTENGLSFAEKSWKTALEFLDLGVFHAVATLWIPPMLIGSVVEAANRLLDSAIHLEMPGDPLRRLLMKGVNPLVNRLAGHTQPRMDALLQRRLAPWVAGAPLATANRWLNRHRTGLTRLVRFFAHTAETLEKIPGLKRFLNTAQLQGNVRALETLTFNPENLARLLFLKPWPVLIGIGMVPLIAHPFDRLMIALQNWTIRPLMGKHQIERRNGGRKSLPNPAFWGEKAVMAPSVNLFPSAVPVRRHAPSLVRPAWGQPVAPSYGLPAPASFSRGLRPYSQPTGRL